MNVHASHNVSPTPFKDVYYEALRNAYDECPAYDEKIVLGGFNAKVDKEEVYRPTIGKYSLYDSTNENGERMVFFAGGSDLVVKSTFFQHISRHLAI